MEKITKNNRPFASSSFLNYFSIWEWALFGALIIAGILLRWPQLADRPLHHDESLYGIYGIYYYMNPSVSFYKYDPMLHGPFLYHTLPFVYKIFGMGKWALRFLPALIGSFFIFAPLCFKKVLKPKVVLILTAFISLSPTLIYWSRYIRHDPFVILFMLLAVWGILCAKKSHAIFIVLISITLQFCVKENAYVTSALILGLIIFEKALSIIEKSRVQTWFDSICIYLKKYRIQTLVAIAISILIYCYFYSSEFRYSRGILDGLYRKSLAYWFNQHHIERIKGPFSFNLFMLSWYELSFVIIGIVQLFHFYLKRSWKQRTPFLSATILALILFFTYRLSPIESYSWSSLTKVKLALDFFPFLIIPIHAIASTTIFFKEKNRAMAILNYFFWATLFTYSYLGEKVPWLAVYPFIFGLAFYVQYINQNFSKKFQTAALVFTIIYGSYMSLLVNHIHSGDKNELISQVHTSKEYENFLLMIKDKIDHTTPADKSPTTVLALKENIWPMSWYLYGKPEYSFLVGNKKLKSFNYVYTTFDDPASKLLLEKTHKRITMPLRSWWVPDYYSMNLFKFLRYAITHTPWNSPGDQMISIWCQKKEDINNQNPPK